MCAEIVGLTVSRSTIAARIWGEGQMGGSGELETGPREIGTSTLASAPPSPSARILIKKLILVAKEISAHPPAAT